MFNRKPKQTCSNTATVLLKHLQLGEFFNVDSDAALFVKGSKESNNHYECMHVASIESIALSDHIELLPGDCKVNLIAAMNDLF